MIVFDAISIINNHVIEFDERNSVEHDDGNTVCICED